MVYVTVGFDLGVPASPTGVGRALEPRATIILHSGTALAWQSMAVVDTGATFCQLPTQAANLIGLSLAPAVNCTVMTAGGTVVLQQMLVDLTIHGRRVQVLANFGPGSPALIGRDAMFAAMQTAGFRARDWLINW
ncbi:MAG: hypothetical protein JO352_31840 [Chloroflexi bacterium]|nr:hypothetical protein [Chloroflexota bacterium]MBV9602632.1 hypothetical protein [Chloroflexota bacterium]